MKIIVAGAGIGGLFAAYLFGKKGHEVVVYEKTDCPENMRYDWHDDINPYDFAELGLELPKESFKKKNWTFVSPGGEVQEMTQSEKNTDFSVERKPLNLYLCGLAEEVAKLNFGTVLSGACVEEGKVAGVTFADGHTEKCDLLIDSCGVDSVIRKSLPDSFGIGKVGEESIFVVYRAFFDAVPDAPVKYTNKVYMKHCGHKGISWCIVDNDPTKINVLVGAVGALDTEYLNYALGKLREDNPVLGKEVQRGGIVARIPVRRPLDVFVGDGYAAIGDSACMTVPLIGSGIITSLKAAKHLFDAVGEGNSAPVEKLWEYEKKVYEDFGATHCGVDYMKNWLLTMKDSDMDTVFRRKILSNRDMQELSIGRLIKLGFKDLLSKVRAAGTYAVKLIPMAKMLSKTHKIAKTAAKIPAEYNPKAISRWKNKLNKNFC